MSVYVGMWIVAVWSFGCGWVGRSWVLYRKDARAMEAARYRHPSYQAPLHYLDPPAMPQWLKDHLGRSQW